MKSCYLCGEGFEDGQLVELTVIAPWRKVKSKVAFCVGKPEDAYADTLRHHICPQNDYDSQI